MVEDVKGISKYNWTVATWMFLVEAIEETNENMCIIRNLQIMASQ